MQRSYQMRRLLGRTGIPDRGGMQQVNPLHLPRPLADDAQQPDLDGGAVCAGDFTIARPGLVEKAQYFAGPRRRCVQLPRLKKFIQISKLAVLPIGVHGHGRCRLQQLEGVVTKRRVSVCEPGERSGAWVKPKLDRQQEFVNGGYRPNARSVDGLLVGHYEGKHLKFAAKVRAGFVPRTRSDLYKQLRPLKRERCPYVDLPSGPSRWGSSVTADEMDEMSWVKPHLVVQVRFVEWTGEGRLRHANYLGLWTDKAALDGVREIISS